MVGTVKWFSDKLGFGFIVAEGVEGDIFVHYSSIRKSQNEKRWRTLKEGAKVEFSCNTTEKGFKAFDVVEI